MRHGIKKYTFVLVMAMFILLANTASAADTSLSSVKEHGLLRVGTTGDYMPLSMLDKKTGEYTGFDADLAKDLASDLKVKLTFVPTSWPTLTQDLQAGKFDVAMCGITINDARKEAGLLSDGYLKNGKTLICRTEDVECFTCLEDVDQPDVTVMVNPGGTNEKFVQEHLTRCKVIVHDVNEEIPGLIAQGQADVMITEYAEAGYYTEKDDRIAAPLMDSLFSTGEIGAFLPADSLEMLSYINDFLKREKESGRIDELTEKYIGDADAESDDTSFFIVLLGIMAADLGWVAAKNRNTYHRQ